MNHDDAPIFARLLRAARIPGAILVAAAAAGCGTGDANSSIPSVSPHPVTGKVVLADGSPLTGGLVVLVPTAMDAVGASGSVKPDGSFALSTYAEGDGVADGEYTVRVEPPRPAVPVKPKALPKPPFPKKYTDEAASGLKVKIESSTSELPPIALK